MLDFLFEKFRKIITSRLLPVALLFICLFAVLIHRIFILQIVEGESNSEQINLLLEKTREIKSTRGNIYDRNGVLLAYNKLTYSVIIDESTVLTTNIEKNAMLFNLIQIIEKYGNTIEYEFGLGLDDKDNLYFTVEGSSLLRFKKNVYGKLYSDDLSEEEAAAGPEDVFQYLRYGISTYTPMFNISEEYSLEDALKIMTLRYAIYTNYPKYNQIIICSDVSDETVTGIYENSIDLPGVDIQQQSSRAYNDELYSSHILGYTGLISGTELDALGENTTYTSSDLVGKTGIEKTFESELSGVKGLETISVNSSGKFIDILSRNDPVAGSDIYLTIDSRMQEAYYKIIERNLAGILLSKINNSTDAGTRGVSAKDIRIPINDVYYALINNNIIKINNFNTTDASAIEKEVYQKFVEKLENVLLELEDILSIENSILTNESSEEMQEYLAYIFSELKNEGILLTTSMNTEDTTYQNYMNNRLSLSDFLQYAIANNWVDLNKLNIGDEYFSTEELYIKVLDYTKSKLLNDTTFHKKIYKNLVYSYKVSGSEICLLLFEQGVLKYNEEEVTKLTNGTLSPYTFIKNKIKNLEITPAQLALNPCSASVVVIDVKTGDVLSMVSYPSYNINLFANKIDSEYYSQLSTDLTTPMYPRATKQRTAPGSTFKMVTAIAGLEEGVLAPTETIHDDSEFTNVVPSPKCWSSISHGSIDVTTALEVSCNYFFYEVGWRLGLDSTGTNRDQLGLEQLSKYATILGLDEVSGIEIEESQPLISDEGSVRSAIGQGTNNFTPIQLARYVTTIATSGKSYDLTLLSKIIDKDGNLIQDNQASYEQLSDFQDSTWDLVQEGMYKVGNGEQSSISSLFEDYPILVAGKTGTAQESIYNPNHALFVSYAPYEDPEISVTVVIPNGYASSNAVELARDVYSYYFDLDGADLLTEGPAETPDADGHAFSD